MNRALLIAVSALLFSAACVFGVSAGSVQSATTAADEPCPTPKLRTNVRPNADGPPTEVSVGVRMIDLLDIDDVNQTITVDLAIHALRCHSKSTSIFRPSSSWNIRSAVG